MNELEELRKKIDEIDRELFPLFLERMEVCSQVADYKRKVGMSVLDSKREAEVLAEKVKLAENTDMTAEVYEFFNSIMSISRVRQTRELTGEKNRVRIEDIT
ncbi:MAG: chorismate mutase, partial [Clostridia bacterium]|nr:chorismate mutase [Clostridia bacterium]